MNITGKTMIFKNTYGYSTAISKKDKEGNYEKMYVQVQFPKDIELENKTMINITKSFLSFYKTKIGLAQPKIVVMDFEFAKLNDNEENELPF